MEAITCPTTRQTIFGDFPLNADRWLVETLTCNKVYDYDITIAVPHGARSYVWIKKKESVFLIHVDGQGNVCDLFALPNVIMRNTDHIGSILYGTHLVHHDVNRFVCHDVLVPTIGRYIDRLEIIANVYASLLSCKLFRMEVARVTTNFKEMLEQTATYNVKHFVMVGSNEKVVNMISNFTRQIKQNTHIPERKPNILIQPHVKRTFETPFPACAIFSVSPDVQNDVYSLSYMDEEETVMFAKAGIPDYKTSVMMNHIFRNIKENADLDALEESDTEEDFEDERVDRFVFLDKVRLMQCSYNKHHRNWCPVRLALPHETISTKKFAATVTNFKYNM